MFASESEKTRIRNQVNSFIALSSEIGSDSTQIQTKKFSFTSPNFDGTLYSLNLSPYCNKDKYKDNAQTLVYGDGQLVKAILTYGDGDSQVYLGTSANALCLIPDGNIDYRYKLYFNNISVPKNTHINVYFADHNKVYDDSRDFKELIKGQGDKNLSTVSVLGYSDIDLTVPYFEFAYKNAGINLTPEQEAALNSGITASSVSSYSSHIGNTSIHVTSGEKETWNGKQNALTEGTGITLQNNTISVDLNTVHQFTDAEASTLKFVASRTEKTATTYETLTLGYNKSNISVSADSVGYTCINGSTIIVGDDDETSEEGQTVTGSSTYVTGNNVGITANTTITIDADKIKIGATYEDEQPKCSEITIGNSSKQTAVYINGTLYKGSSGTDSSTYATTGDLEEHAANNTHITSEERQSWNKIEYFGKTSVTFATGGGNIWRTWLKPSDPEQIKYLQPVKQ